MVASNRDVFQAMLPKSTAPTVEWRIHPYMGLSDLLYHVELWADADGTGMSKVDRSDSTMFASEFRKYVREMQKKHKVLIQNLTRKHVQAIAHGRSVSWLLRRDKVAKRSSYGLQFVRAWTLNWLIVAVVYFIVASCVTGVAQGFHMAGFSLAVSFGGYVVSTILQTWLVDDPSVGVDFSKLRL